MGKKGSWFSSVKKALGPESKEKKAKKSKQKWAGNEKYSHPNSSTLENETISHPLSPPQDVILAEVEEEQTNHADSVAVATAAMAEAKVAAAQAAADVVRLATAARFPGKSIEEVAAMRIQTAFRGYSARRALRALRGLVRLKTLVEGTTVKRQTTNTLRCMQGLSRVQSQINSRRIRMSEENQALQRQLLQKRAKELENLQMGEEWDTSLQSKEQVEAKLLSKYEAAMKRERAMAYSFSHQQTWKKSVKSTNLLYMDPTNPQWGWSWLERWMASASDKESQNDHLSLKSTNITEGEITKAYSRHQLNSDNLISPKSHISTPRPKASISARKLKPASSKASVVTPEDDSKSVFSVQSERNRRHSIAASVRDDESFASSPSVPSYMAQTQSAKARIRLQSPVGTENETPSEKVPAGFVKKRLSFTTSPTRPRRHSGPPKVDSSVVVDRSLDNGTS